MEKNRYRNQAITTVLRAHLFREGDRAVEIVAETIGNAEAKLPSRVKRAYPYEKADYWKAFTYCGSCRFD